MSDLVTIAIITGLQAVVVEFIRRSGNKTRKKLDSVEQTLGAVHEKVNGQTDLLVEAAHAKGHSEGLQARPHDHSDDLHGEQQSDIIERLERIERQLPAKSNGEKDAG